MATTDPTNENPFVAQLQTEYEWTGKRRPELSEQESSQQVEAAERLLLDYLLTNQHDTDDDFEEYTRFLCKKAEFYGPNADDSRIDGMMMFCIELMNEVQYRTRKAA